MEVIEDNMVQQQILSLILQTSDFSIVRDNLLTVDYFIEYQDEYTFIKEHIDKYGNVPDKETFLMKFPDFEILEVNESERYLVETVREEYNYAQTVPIVQNIAKLLQSDANDAIEYLQSQAKVLNPSYSLGGVDIAVDTESRRKESEDRENNKRAWYLESGFPELDDIMDGGIQRGEEFIVLVARLGHGKSWTLLKMCAHVWQTGFNVGYISPEMSANMIGFRFDTVVGHFSNRVLLHGGNKEGYDEYLDHVENGHKFMVATPKDFNKKITVSKLRAWIKQNNLDLIAVDGIKYLKDEREQRGDNATTRLTNISEDLMDMSVELGVPVLVVVQANRGGVRGADEEGTPETEDIRDSDGIAQNATKVISIRQKRVDNSVRVEMGVKKDRYGQMGSNVSYNWDIDTGVWTFLDFGKNVSIRDRRAEDKLDKKTGSGRNVF